MHVSCGRDSVYLLHVPPPVVHAWEYLGAALAIDATLLRAVEYSTPEVLIVHVALEGFLGRIILVAADDGARVSPVAGL